MKHSIAHKHNMNSLGMQAHPDGLVPWRGEQPFFRKCGYCGSMHPEDTAAAIRAGLQGSWADLKYSWPHKAYFTDPESGGQHKFYSVHLQDASPEDRETIEVHLGVRFEFIDDGQKVRWSSIDDKDDVAQDK